MIDWVGRSKVMEAILYADRPVGLFLAASCLNNFFAADRRYRRSRS
jgi:hypothetical protein